MGKRETGAEINTVGYLPGRGTTTGDTDIINDLWGDSYGNRCDRFLACAAYVGNTNSDGKLLPSLIMCRGYYTRTAVVAWDFDGSNLTERWAFDTDTTSTYSVNSTGTSIGKDNLSYSYYKGMGAHSLATGDVDGDGYDEIVYGAMTIDNDGIGLYTTGNCHGDATHLGDFIPSNDGLEFFMPSESAGSTNKVTGGTNPTCWVSNAADGTILWENETTESDDVWDM